MEQLDVNAANAQEFEELHAAIEEGDLETVMRIAESHGEEQFFSFEETSALYKAFQCKNYEIISFLIHKGTKFVGSEDKYVYNFRIDLDRLNYLLIDYNKKSHKSCIFKLMSLSQSPQVLDGERMNALLSMYEYLFQSDIIKLLMDVVERVDLDIVFDFESDKVNRIHRLYEEEADVLGLTLSDSKEIFVGAKGLLSCDLQKRATVYGVVAEELCHMAMTAIFQNNAKPYKEEDSNLIQEFHDIVLAVKAFTDRSCHIESVIQDVYECYSGYSWECELIARVPHVIGIHGEEIGRRVFQESSELYRLLTFYEQNVHEKCKLYTDPSLNKRSHREMEQLITKDFISFKEKQIQPLKENFQSFRRYLVEWESISVLTTNCTRLCMLHVYHELKKEYEYLVEKKCLFFTRKCFEKKIYEIRDTMKGNLWEYLILVMDKRELYLSRFQAEYLDHLEEFTTNGMKLIIISSSQSTDQKFDFQKAVNYKWSDLSEEYKTILQCIKYLFKGEEEDTYVRKEYFSEVFNEDDISMIISGELIEVDDGNELFSHGYIPETYIEREFHSTVVDDKIFKNLSPHTNIFLSGLKDCKLGELPFSKDMMQCLKGSDDKIQGDKSIFIANKDSKMSFDVFRERNPNRTNIWLHYDENEFHAIDINSSSDVFSHHVKQKFLSEEEILKFLKRKRIVIISDNAGYGKSTVISNLIDDLKRNNYRSWNWRIDLKKFSGNENDPLSIANIEEESDDEEVLDHLFCMLGLKNGFEKYLFREHSKGGHCFIFFDGFDEIPSEHKNSTLKLLFIVRDKTFANMIITTRKHHQKELEQLMNTYSHQLVPFSRKNQIKFLEKLWKNKLMHPYGRGTDIFLKDKKKVPGKIKKIIEESKKGRTGLDQELKELIFGLEVIDLSDSLDSVKLKIDDLKFSKLAETVIDKTSFDKDLLEFMGIPLHLFMIGVIYFDSNFNVEIQSDIYSIYSKFIDQKIRIYLEEKQGIMYHGRAKEKVIKNETIEAYRIHIELANQSMDNVKIDLNEEDLEFCTALGIVIISGAEVDFLHHTFAEFFIAESIRMNTNKVVFTEMLFDDKYNVVKRFLSNALEKKNFENLTDDFFKDVDFLFPVLEKFVYKYRSTNFNRTKEANLYFLIAKIVKCLLEMYEKTVHPDLLNEFVINLESKLLLLENWYWIGGCLTVKIIRMLLSRNFKIYLNVIFSVVACNSNPEEVISVMSECISILTARESHKKKRKNTGTENKNAGSILYLLQIRDTRARGLLHWAICNAKAEMFAIILKWFKDILGEEEFINEIVQSTEYREAIFQFLNSVDFNRFCVLLKELHSVFDNDIEILFDTNLKFWITKKTICSTDKLSNAFENVNYLFNEYLGIEKLKEVLISHDLDGNYLIHCLAFHNRNAIEILNIISNILNDKDKMKQLLESRDFFLRNVFHFAAKNQGMYFGDILVFCYDYLEKGEIRKMLISADEDGEKVLHSLFAYNSSKMLIENFNLMKNTLADDELFKQVLKSKGSESRNIFHCAFLNENEINMSFLNLHLHESEIRDLLIDKDNRGRTCLHLGARAKHKNLPDLLDYLFEMLKFDERQFEEFILAKDNDGNTFLHQLVTGYSTTEIDFANIIIKSLIEKLSNDLLRKLLTTRNKKIRTFIQNRSRYRKEIIKFLKGNVEINFFEELLQ